MMIFTSEESGREWIKFRKALKSTATCRERLKKKSSWIHHLWYRFTNITSFLSVSKTSSSTCYNPTYTHIHHFLLPWPLSVPRSKLCGSACVTSLLVLHRCLMTLHLLHRAARRGDKITKNECEIRSRKMSSFQTVVEAFSHWFSSLADGLFTQSNILW